MNRLQKPIFIITVSIGLTFILFQTDWDWLESRLYDLRVRRGGTLPASAQIALVALDQQTEDTLEEFLPLGLKSHVRLLKKLEAYAPKAVGYLVDFNAVARIAPDEFNVESANELLALSESWAESSRPLLFTTQYEVVGEVPLPELIAPLPHAVSLIHRDGNTFGFDKVSRRAPVMLAGHPTFHLEFTRLIREVNPSAVKELLPPGTFQIPDPWASYFFFRYHRANSPDGKTSLENAYPIYSAAQVLDGSLPKSKLEGKIILVGTRSKDDSNDFTFTPETRVLSQASKLVSHAHILDSYLHAQGVRLAPKSLGPIATILTIGFVLFWVLESTPLHGVFASIGLLGLWIGFTHLSFRQFGFWLREAEPMAGMVLGYYLAVPLRLISEYRKRWEYQRKNELLEQVEEMKRNFLSLVTHDLKTPIARIQGHSEMLLRGDKSDHQKPQLESIASSAEELNHFIGSILELTRVESSHFAPRFSSKDVNRVIERSIELHTSQAERKSIQIESSLEPLFPIELDPDLLLKVINNLLDNAIKYSPNNTCIKIHSAEVTTPGLTATGVKPEAKSEPAIEITIKDQGYGMSEDEKNQLFTRFFRGKVDRVSHVPGTGLGLYLSRYFVELHAGVLSVESREGEGTEFKIKLPVKQAKSQSVSLGGSYVSRSSR